MHVFNFDYVFKGEYIWDMETNLKYIKMIGYKLENKLVWVISWIYFRTNINDMTVLEIDFFFDQAVLEIDVCVLARLNWTSFQPWIQKSIQSK